MAGQKISTNCAEVADVIYIYIMVGCIFPFLQPGPAWKGMIGFMGGPLGWQRAPTPSGGEGTRIGDKINQLK